MLIESVRVTRDSLGALDQFKAAQPFTARVIAKTTVQELILDVFPKLKAHDSAYASATWSITSNRPLAVVAKAWRAPRILLRSVRRMEDTVMMRDKTAHLHFCLHAEADPETLYKNLDQLSFPHLGESKP